MRQILCRGKELCQYQQGLPQWGWRTSFSFFFYSVIRNLSCLFDLQFQVNNVHLKINPFKRETCKKSHAQEKSWTRKAFKRVKRWYLQSLRRCSQKQKTPSRPCTFARRSSRPYHCNNCLAYVRQLTIPAEASSEENALFLLFLTVQ